MPRKKKNAHSSPEFAGAHNIPDEMKAQMKIADGEENIMEKLLPIYKIAMERRDYTGQWTEETLRLEIGAYFNYCSEKSLKPSHATLSLWLGLSKAQYHDWKSDPVKYGYKSELVNFASSIIEGQYIQRAEQYPTANLFLLRTSHQHVEASKVDVTSNGKTITQDADEVRDLVSRLGLDKK